MLSLNRIMLIGNLGRDAETRFTTGNTEICTFSLATTHSWKKDDNWVNETTWHNVTAFKVSEYVKAGLTKGSPCYVEGRLSKREYTDKEDIKRYSTDVIAEKIISLSKSESEHSSKDNSGQDSGQSVQNEPELPSTNDDLPF